MGGNFSAAGRGHPLPDAATDVLTARKQRVALLPVGGERARPARWTLEWGEPQIWWPEDDPVRLLGCELEPPGQNPSTRRAATAAGPSRGARGGTSRRPSCARVGRTGRSSRGRRNTDYIAGQTGSISSRSPRRGAVAAACAAMRHVETFGSSDGAMAFHNDIATSPPPTRHTSSPPASSSSTAPSTTTTGPTAR